MATIERALGDLASKLLSRADFQTLLHRQLDALAGALDTAEAQGARDGLLQSAQAYAADDDPTADEMKDIAADQRKREAITAAFQRLRAAVSCD